MKLLLKNRWKLFVWWTCKDAPSAGKMTDDAFFLSRAPCSIDFKHVCFPLSFLRQEQWMRCWPRCNVGRFSFGRPPLPGRRPLLWARGAIWCLPSDRESPWRRWDVLLPMDMLYHVICVRSANRKMSVPTCRLRSCVTVTPTQNIMDVVFSSTCAFNQEKA